jgi:peptidoglycan/LPS O-acetylase OafA/YrhL
MHKRSRPSPLTSRPGLLTYEFSLVIGKGIYPSVQSGSRASTNLDCIRGLAALTVYAFHIRWLFYPQYRDLVAPNIAVQSVYFLTKMGHLAVIVFFVLSGYLVGGSVLRDMSSGRWSWKSYLLKRGTRLYVVLVPALILTAFWDTAAKHFTTAQAIQSTDVPLYATIVSSSGGLPALVCNLLFLQTIVSPPYGSNVALWSLSWEWWYYILFPCCLMIAKSVRRVEYGIIAVSIVLLIGWQITAYFAIWLMGATIGLWPKRVLAHLQIPVLLFTMAAMLIIGVLIEAKSKSLSACIAGDFGVGMMTSLLVGALVKDTSKIKPGLYASFSHRLANLSYTLYVVHLPFLIFLRLVFVKMSLSPTIASLPALLLIFGSGIVYSTLVWRVTEAKTGQFREAIANSVRLVSVPNRLRSTRSL